MPAHEAAQAAISATCRNIAADFSVVAYNIANAPGIAVQTPERRGHTLLALQHELAADDVIALEEVWEKETVERAAQLLHKTHPYVFFVDTRGEGETGLDRCEKGEMDEVVACTERQCAGVRAEDFSICALKRCATSLRAMYLREWPEKHIFGRQTSCFNCLIASLGKSLGDILRTCVSARGASKAYAGWNGLVVFSRYPFINSEVIRLPASGANRVALLARVILQNGRAAELAFTHLSSGEALPPMHPAFSTWEEERRTQFSMIADRMVGRGSDDTPILIVGDLNFGPGRDDIAPYGERNWHEAVARGFMSPTVMADRPLATFPLGNTVSRSLESYQVDHALFRPLDGIMPVCVEQVFDERVLIRGKHSNLSDHLGVRTKFTFK